MHNTLLSMLESLSCVKVLEAAGALSAYDLLHEVRANTVVINANLPHTERLTLLKRIRQELPTVHCIALTSTTRNHRSLGEAGADVLLLQCCSQQEVAAVVCAPTPRDTQA